VAAAWQGKELLRAIYAADDLADARAALDRFYRWVDGVGVPELSRLARTVRAWEAEILAFHSTQGCSNGPTVAVNFADQEGEAGRARLPQLHQLSPAAAVALRRQVADASNRTPQKALPRLDSVKLMKDSRARSRPTLPC